MKGKDDSKIFKHIIMRSVERYDSPCVYYFLEQISLLNIAQAKQLHICSGHQLCELYVPKLRSNRTSLEEITKDMHFQTIQKNTDHPYNCIAIFNACMWYKIMIEIAC